MGCGITTVKYLLFFFNLVFALCGLAILIAGALTYVNIDKANYFMQGVSEKVNFTASPIALMVVGSIIFVIAFFGCCGAIRESHCMIITFAVLLLTILIVEIAIGIVIFVRINEEGWEQALNETITEKFGRYIENNPPGELSDAVNNLQRDLECCGVDGPAYWSGRGFQNPPHGCCINPDVQQCSFQPSVQQVFQEGCVARLTQLLKDIGLVLGILAIAVGVIQIIGVVFALCLASSIRNKERRGVA